MRYISIISRLKKTAFAVFVFSQLTNNPTIELISYYVIKWGFQTDYVILKFVRHENTLNIVTKCLWLDVSKTWSEKKNLNSIIMFYFLLSTNDKKFS